VDEAECYDSCWFDRNNQYPDRCRRGDQHHHEGDQASPALAAEMTSADPEILIDKHGEGPSYQHFE
jgi:hypothetical protein